jgi:hypothetical protein
MVINTKHIADLIGLPPVDRPYLEPTCMGTNTFRMQAEAGGGPSVALHSNTQTEFAQP